MNPIFVIGDVHGQLDTLAGLLRGADLIGPDQSWRGGESTLWLMGDLVDRGPDGVAVIALAMRLQQEAARAGGHVGVLLGNHDVLLLGAKRFGATASSGPGGTFLTAWRESGGEPGDLARLTASQAAWLAALPALALEGETLLMHADATFYGRYGHSIEEVNRAMRELLQAGEPVRWDHLLDAFEEHRAFADGAAGVARAGAVLARFGGRRIVHGHSPISSITGQPPGEVREPLIYADGLCVDVDGGIYRGGPGLVYRLPAAARY